jgi:hypothetical protein
VTKGVNASCSEKCTDQDTGARCNRTWHEEQERPNHLDSMESDELQAALVGNAEPQVDGALDSEKQAEREVKYLG